MKSVMKTTHTLGPILVLLVVPSQRIYVVTWQDGTRPNSPYITHNELNLCPPKYRKIYETFDSQFCDNLTSIHRWGDDCPEVGLQAGSSR